MTLRPIIVKKIKKVEGGHHGGAWKVAYADFVTAMMAFFLLMWLLNATTEEQRSGLADYFDPKIPVSQQSSGGVSMFNGDSVFAQNKLARSGLGGAGKKAAAGREDNERHEVSSSEDDAWSKNQKEQELVGNKKTFDGILINAEKASIIGKKNMSMEDIKKKIKKSLKATGNEGLFKNLNFKMTDEGLRIDITDGAENPMFRSGSDEPTDNMKKIVAIVGNVLSLLKNNLSITGHTDSTPIKSKRNYSNWELSSDRANASRRELVAAGIENKRIKRIEGRADTQPLVKDDPENAQNRRIGIIILRDNSAAAMKKKLHEQAKNKALKEHKAKEEAIRLENDVRRNKANPFNGELNQERRGTYIPDPLVFD